jgi:hypothetical protein
VNDHISQIGVTLEENLLIPWASGSMSPSPKLSPPMPMAVAAYAERREHETLIPSRWSHPKRISVSTVTYKYMSQSLYEPLLKLEKRWKSNSSPLRILIARLVSDSALLKVCIE